MLGFLEHAEVLEPPELRADVADAGWRPSREPGRGAPSRSRADVRLRRLLAMVPWLARQDGPSVAEVCARFGITAAELQADLELLTLYVGVPPYTPDGLFDLSIEGDRVSPG